LTAAVARAGVVVDTVAVVDAWAPVSGYPPPPPPSPFPPPVESPKAKDNTQQYIIAGACSGGGLFLGLVAFGIWYATRKNAAAMTATMKGGYSDDPGGTRFDPFGGAGGAAAKKHAERASKKAAWEKKRRGDSGLKAIAPGGGGDVEGGRGGSMFGGFGRKKHAKVSPLKGPVVSKPVRGAGAKRSLHVSRSAKNIGSVEHLGVEQSSERPALDRERERQFVPEKEIDASFVWEGASTRGGSGGGDYFGPRGTA
jgi:hypothetical protein